MGEQAAKALEEMIKSADNRAADIVATIVGVVALIVTATGVFGEVQSAMNAIWKAKPNSSTLSRLVRARLASLGLVVTCGFLLTVSLAVSAGLQALSKFLSGERQVSDRALCRSEQCCLVLRRGRRPDRASAVDLLYGPDFSFGRRVHPRIRQTPRQPRRR